MKITHLVTLLTCFTLSLSLPLFGNPLPVTSPVTRRTTEEGTRTPDSTFQPTTVTSSTQGITVDTTTATEVTSSTASDVTTRSAKTTATPSTYVVTTRSNNARETSGAGTTATASAIATVTLNRLRRTILETTPKTSSTATSRETPATTVTSTATSRPTTSTRRGTTRDPRCTVRSRDFRPHTIDSAPDANMDDAVEERALCKFEYALNTDNRRHPANMPEAVCSRKKCGHCGGDGRCEPVHHSFKVLRRCRDLDDDGNYLYRYDYERLAVACVCATPAPKDARPVMPARPDSDDDGPAPTWD